MGLDFVGDISVIRLFDVIYRKTNGFLIKLKYGLEGIQYLFV